MLRRTACVAVLLSVIVAGSAWADVVVIKEGSQVIVGGYLDAAFAGVTAGDIVNATVNDTAFHDNTGANVGYGDLDLFTDGTDDKLMKFDVASLPGFVGGTIHVAQLQIRQTAGNAGQEFAVVTTHDWTEALATRFSPIGSSVPEWGPASDSVFGAADHGIASGMTVGSFETGPFGIYEAWMVADVTEDVQAMAAGQPNYGWWVYTSNRNIVSSENVEDAYRPSLFISYTVAAPPTDITDLSIASVDWFEVGLMWTAPSDTGEESGGAAAYDIRYSTSPIDAGNWDSATQVSDEPIPAGAGLGESFSVGGLTANTTYYFAVKSVDSVGFWSGLSNVAQATTLVTDAVAPAAVVDLSVSDVRPNHVVLAWTSVGDDGASTGTASEYDVRYSTSPIDAGNFASATPATGEPAPQAPGNAETVEIHGLTASTTYYFAVKAGDEVPNFGAISNVASATTLTADYSAANAVTDLTVDAIHIQTAYLSWSAPLDNGSAGVGSYDVRYSTSPIDAGNWASATQVSGEPSPSAPGVTDSMLIAGLSASTTYYFAITSADMAEPANVSGLSNVISATTMDPVPPVVVQNVWIANDRVADTRNLTTIGATFQNAYTPDGVVAPSSNEDRVVNCYNNMKRRYYHWAEQPPNFDDSILNLNVFGWALCGRHADTNCLILQAVEAYGSYGIGNRKIALPGHWVYEAGYDSAWHVLCTMTTWYQYNRAQPPAIASCAEVSADHSLTLNAVAEGRACPGYLLCGDTPEWYASVIDAWSSGPGGVTPTHSMQTDLAVGQTLSRTWEAWATQHPPILSDPPYHHESQHDWKDTVNYPYWEPYGLVDPYIDPSKTTYRRWSNGTFQVAPDFRSTAYQAVVDSSVNIATYDDDASLPELHVAAAGTPAEVVFKVDIPYYLTDATIDGDFTRTNAGDVIKLHVSPDGTNWVQVWDNTATGTTLLRDLSLRSAVYNTFGYWVKVELESAGAITDVGVDNLKINTVIEHNKGAMPYLDKGKNNITVTLDNPQDLGGSVAFKVTYNWKEYDGADWTIAKSHTQYITSSPAVYTITTSGSKVPRTESIVMEVTSPPAPDGMAPAAITDLAAGNPDSTTVDLTWTASGDDGAIGQATSYQIRYSTSSINEANWASATPVADPPSPQGAGNVESFTATGLPSSSTLYFAIKALDEGGMASALSNIAVETTLAPDVTAPAAIDDLAATVGTAMGSIDLTWTAPGDSGSTGTAASYDVRYSTSAINDGNFAGATQVTGVSAPQTAGSAESVTVTGLTMGQLYYFAIKTSDEVPNVSALSNVVSETAQLGEATLQDGLNGYGGTRDTYISAANPDLNYGSAYERMTVTGYEDLGAENRQRGLVRFDLSSIPQGTSITTAILYVYSYDPSQVMGSAGFYGAYPLTVDWSETGSTWNSPWTTAGGDFNATPDATAAKQSTANVWYAFNVTSRVQQWINNGGTDNYGWVIKCADEMLHNQDRFYQKDTSNAAYRPKLFISDQAADVTPPGAITDLAAATGTASGSVDLTWTATGDDGATGTASSYAVRYSTSLITEANWASATVASGTPTPQASGSAESFTVTGLATGQTYYFAIKSADEMLNEGALSNVVSAEAILGTLILQEGTNGYTGTDDSYLSAGAPDSNYDAYERMTVTGYEDLGATNRARGVVKFDVSGISPGSVISSAKLQLYAYDEAQHAGSSGTYAVHPVTADWAVASVTWNAPWTTAGGDYDATADATAPVQATALVWYEFDVTARVQAWIDTPSSNRGWVVKVGDEMLHVQDRFYQSDGVIVADRPKLIIQDVAAFVVSVDASPVCGGSVTGGGAYADGQTCNLTAVANEGNTFVQWIGGPIHGSTNVNESFTVTDDETITATFQADPGTISVCDYATLEYAVQTAAGPGDVVLVQPGTYQLVNGSGRLSLYNAGEPGNPITVRGVMNGNQRPILEPAPGQEVNRGFFHIWDVDHDWVFENLEFRNLRGFNVLYGPNAAGIYVTGDDITVRNCVFHDNDQGMSGAAGSTNLLVENCEFYTNGSDLNLGYTHNLYMNNDSITLRGNYIHDAYGGINFKSRTPHQVLEYNWLDTDGSEAFVINAAQYNQNNSLWLGNVFIKRSTPGGQRRILSLDDGSGLTGTITMINNTVISPLAEDIFISSVSTSSCDLVLKNNIFAGPAGTLLDWNGSGTVTGSNNVFPTALSSEIPAGVTGSILSDNPGFVNLGTRDLHLLETSICRNAGIADPTCKDENQQWVIVVPTLEPTKSLTTDPRLADATLDIGAFEYDSGLPGVAFDLTSSSGSEAVTTVTLSVSLDTASDQIVTVDFAVTGGTAVDPDDYAIAASPLTFGVGVTQQDIVITVVDDGDVESDETIEVTLSNPSNAALGANTVHTYTIANDDVLATVGFDLTSSSGSEAVTTVNLSVSLDQSVASTVTVPFSVTGGTAVDPDDFTIAASPLTFNPGVTQQDVVITVVNDGVVEADQTVEVTLGSPTNATLGANTVHTYTIANDDAYPTVAFDLASSSGDEAVTTVSLSVSLDASYDEAVTVDFAVTGGTAVDPDDYAIAASPLTFGVGVTQQDVVITIVDDGIVEADETVEVTLSNPSNATLGVNTVHTYTIVNDDAYPTVAFDLASSSGDEAVTTVSLSVSLDAAYGEAVTVDFAVTGGTAVDPDDYAIAASPLTFGVGVTQQDVVITVVDDGIVEADETIEVTLSNPSNATLGIDVVHTYTVTNDDAYPTVAFDLTSSSGAEGVATVNLSVSLDAAYGEAVTVDFAVTGGTAVDPDDYAIATSPLTFGVGVTQQDVVITVVDDAVVEADETVEVTLSNPSNATLGVNTVHTYTIVDDEPVVLRVGPGQPYSTVQAAVNDASDGDTIEIYSATYTGTEGNALIPQNNLTLRGMGATRPVLDAGGLSIQGKAIWVITGSNTTVESIEFQNCDVVDNNGAAIRQEGADLTVTECYIHDNEQGILVGANATSDILVQYCEFEGNGYISGGSHNIYVNVVASFTLRHCWMHSADTGHEVKSRAALNIIEYNRITNENGTASYEVQLPDGGTTYIVGNVIQQGPNTSNSNIIMYADESTSNPDLHLYVVNNTIVNERPAGGTFINNLSGVDCLVQNNIFVGPGTVLSGLGTQVTNWATTDAALVDQANFDYHLTASSAGAINMGSDPGLGQGYALTPVLEYLHPTDGSTRPSDATLDIGAYEYTGALLPTVEFDLTSSSGNEAVTTVNVSVSLDAAYDQVVTVPFTVTGGTAVDPDDYSIAASPLTFGVGVTQQDIVVTVVDDDIVEADETVEVTLATPTNAVLGTNTVHTYTITDDDAYPTVAFDLTSSSGDEAVATVNVSVSLDATYGEVVTVPFTVTGGTAVDPDDYSIAASPLTFGVGVTQQDIVITVVDDGIVEADETVAVTLASPTNATLGATTVHTYTIVNDDAYPTVAFDLTSSSGDEAVTTVNVSVSLDAAYGEVVTVPFTVTGGTAVDPDDYAVAASPLTFGVGVTQQDIVITVIDDAVVEADETIEVALASPSNATLGVNTVHTYTIVDDDVAAQPDVEFNLVASSGDESTTPANIEVVLSEAAATTVTVDYSLTGGTATEGIDFSLPSVPTSGVIALKRDAGLTAGGALSAQFATLGAGDVVQTTVKDAELYPAGVAFYTNYGLTQLVSGFYGGPSTLHGWDLSAYSGATITKAELRLHCVGGNTGMWYAGVRTHNWAEGNKDGDYPGAPPAAEGVCWKHPNGLYTTAAGDAGWGDAANADFDDTAGTGDVTTHINFTSVPAGDAYVVADVTDMVQDWVDGTTPNYGLYVNIGNHGVHLSEIGTDYQPVLFIDYTISGGGSQVVTFDPGVTSQTIPVTITDDGSVEADETIELTLSNPSGATLGIYTVHTYTITDNDAAVPEVSFDATASSGGEAVTTVTLSVSLDQATASTVTVPFTVTGGTAVDPDDFTIAASPLTFTPGVTQQDVVITVVNDGLVETDETVEVTLGTPTNATLGVDAVHTYTITNDDVYPTVSFDATSSSGDEATMTVNLSVSLSASYPTAVTVDFAVTGGDAVDPDDYSIAASPLTFNPGVTQQDVVITVADDGIVEPDETIQVTLSNPSNATLGGATVHTYTILDDDVYPTVAFDLAGSSGDEAVATVNLSVSLDAAYDEAVTVDFAVTGGNAVNPDDYSIAASPLTFAIGVTQQDIVITVVDDGDVESDETVQVTLSNPSNATLGGATVHTYTILDDDSAPLPDQATNPSPATEATKIALTGTILSWTAGNGATSHDVYFGTNATPGTAEFQGNQTGTTFDPGTLSARTWYYWRIDEVNASGTTTGLVWRFRTGNK